MGRETKEENDKGRKTEKYSKEEARDENETE
jgi:hypothetical protein